MDTKSLISDAKARYSHLAAKAQLKDKYKSKLVIADQGGLWVASPELIMYLSKGDDEVILLDSFENPVKVKRVELQSKLKAAYDKTMADWYAEWKDAEKKR
jgi:hypothetical protein